MTKLMKENIILTALVMLSIPSVAFAGSLSISSLAPSPFGNVTGIRFNPASLPTSPSPCMLTTVVAGPDSHLYMCINEGSGNVWRKFGGVWLQDNDNVYLQDHSNPNVRVGIGTTTPEFKLDLTTDGGIIARGAFGAGQSLSTSGAVTNFLWYPRKAAIRAGRVTGDKWNDANIGVYSVAFGLDTQAAFEHSVVSGGKDNIILVRDATIGGGTNNTIYEGGIVSTISGGYNNTIGVSGNNVSGLGATIGGGHTNKAYGYYSTIAGGINNEAGDPNQIIWDFSAFVGAGRGNKANAIDSAVAGGAFNTIELGAVQSFIGGGLNNTIRPNGTSVIGGGNLNIIESRGSVITGGIENHILGTNFAQHTFIGGGWQNTITGNTGSVSTNAVIVGGRENAINEGSYHSAIGGGFQNTITQSSSVISGGYGNTIDSPQAVIGGGLNNSVLAVNGTIAGGNGNIINADAARSTIGGGIDNVISPSVLGAVIAGGNNNQITAGNRASILGGINNTVSGANASVIGGVGNTASGNSAIAGGQNNTAGGIASNATVGFSSAVTGDHSWVGGNNVTLTGNKSFAWGHYGAEQIIPTSDAFLILTGNVGIGVSDPTHSLHISDAMRISALDGPPSACTDDEVGTIYVDINGGGGSPNYAELCFCGGGGAWLAVFGGTCN